jgi:hypothetical protein
LLAKPDIHVHVYKSICPRVIFYVSCIFDLKRRNYSMTCFMFVYTRLRDTDIKLMDSWTIIIVVVEFICRLNKVKSSASANRKEMNSSSKYVCGQMKVREMYSTSVHRFEKAFEISVVICTVLCQNEHVWYVVFISRSLLSRSCTMLWYFERSMGNYNYE